MLDNPWIMMLICPPALEKKEKRKQKLFFNFSFQFLQIEKETLDFDYKPLKKPFESPWTLSQLWELFLCSFQLAFMIHRNKPNLSCWCLVCCSTFHWKQKLKSDLHYVTIFMDKPIMQNYFLKLKLFHVMLVVWYTW